MTTAGHPGDGLDDLEPFDAEFSATQIDALLTIMGTTRRRVLDLGCGSGRVAIPLARHGHQVTGIDHDPTALRRCRDALADADRTLEVRLLEADFAKVWPEDLGSFDVVCCLGNTMMTVVDVDEAVDLLARVASRLEPDGCFVMDDVPHLFWPELAEGHWQSGVSEDGTMQMIWTPGDAVFVLRTGRDVDPDDWRIRASDRRLRLWSWGALRLTGRLAGLSAMERRERGGLLIMRRGG
ncbi:MAG: class I SAM-dependent methyltransferase [Planctomycetota bacterium]